jgi:hypothetical protein
VYSTAQVSPLNPNAKLGTTRSHARLVQQFGTVTSNEKATRSVAKNLPGHLHFRIGYASRRRRSFAGAAWIIRVELHCVMVLDVRPLGCLNLSKSVLVVIDDVQAVSYFVEPESQIPDVSRELVRIQRRELR